MPFKVGMYGGKFCPLHEGHYSVICRALSECDGLIVVLFINGEDEAKFERRWFTEPAFRYYQLCKARVRYQMEHGRKGGLVQGGGLDQRTVLVHRCRVFLGDRVRFFLQESLSISYTCTGRSREEGSPDLCH